MTNTGQSSYGSWPFSNVLGRHWRFLLLFTLLLFVLFIEPTLAANPGQPNRIVLDNPIAVDKIAPSIAFFLDPDWALSIEEMLSTHANQFTPLESDAISFGYTKSKIWLSFDVNNAGGHENNWLIYFRENFIQIFDVYVVREGVPAENLLSLQRDSSFSERAIPYPELVVPLSLAENEQAKVVISYWSEGYSGLELSIETTTSFAELASKRTAKNYVYYGMMIIMIIAAGIFMLVLRETVFVAYLAYAISTLLYLMHADGVAFQFLWPNFPVFNSYASIFIGGSFAIFSCNFARIYLQTGIHHTFVNKVLLAVMITVFFVIVVGTYVDAQWTKKTLIWMALMAIVTCTWSGIVAAFTRFRQVRFYVFAWVGAIVASMIMNMRHIFGIDLAQDLEFDSMRIAMVFDSLMMGFGIADRYNQLRKTNQQAMKKNLTLAETQVAMDNRLQDLQDQYQLAMELAQSRDAEIVKTIHDIRQPLHALRLNVRNLSESPSSKEEERQKVNKTFVYLEKLIANHLMQTIDSTQSTLVQSDGSNHYDEAVSIPSILQSIHEMFLPDALEKGLTFRFRPSRIDADVNHLALMRIVSNLVSNAIRHTENGGLLLACRRSESSLKIEVHNTAGGLSPEAFDRANANSNSKANDQQLADGHGYGLAISHSLANTHDMRLHLCYARLDSTGIRLEIPIHDSQ